ncbi:ABC transporter permease [Metabacillus sp. SLBN-84]
MGFLKLIQNELMKMFSRKSIWFFIVSLVPLIFLSIYIDKNIEPTVNGEYWKQEVKSEMRNLESQLNEMDDEYKEFVEQDIKQLESYLENNINPYQKSQWTFMSFSAGITLFITLAVVILSSRIVANEFSEGTIKLLLVRPFSRFQILASKYITLLIIIALLLAELLIVSYLTGGVLYGFASFDTPTYLLNNQGEIITENHTMYLLKKYMFECISISVIVTISFMISTLINNSAFAITASILTMFSIGTLTSIFSGFTWGKYLLFPNLNLKQYLSSSTGPIEGMTLEFSIVINFIYVIALLSITFLAFKRKEIKF